MFVPRHIGSTGSKVIMLMTKRKPASVDEILVEEFIKPHGLTQGDLAEAMGVPNT